MDAAPEKLTRGEPLTIKELTDYLPALKEVPATLLEKYALGAATRLTFREGDIVCEEGEYGSTAFYIVSGHVEIYIDNPLAAVRTRPGGGLRSFLRRMTSVLVPGQATNGGGSGLEGGFIPIDASVDLPRTTPIAYLGPGELFGEMTCRTFQPRSATVRANEECVMIEMLRVILDMLVGTRDPDTETKATTKVRAPTFKGTSFKKQLDDQYRERSLVSHLRAVPLFATLDLEFFNFLRERAELVSCNKGQVICKQGDPADAFYLIRTGLVRVSQAMPGGEMVRTYLKRGEYFGEIGLLFNQVRNATCSALDAVDLVKIDRDCFSLMLEKFPVVRATLEQVAGTRLEADRERKLPSGLQLDEFLSQGLFEAQNLLLIDLDHCTRCDACVNACADAHDGVTRLIRDGLRYDRYLVATACRSCRDPLCMTQCPVGSIRRKESLEIIIEDWCIGCSKCAELCPYGNINMHSFETKKLVAATPEKPAAAKTAKPPQAGQVVVPAGKPASSKPAPSAGSPEGKTASVEPKPLSAVGELTAPSAGGAARERTAAGDLPVRGGGIDPGQPPSVAIVPATAETTSAAGSASEVTTGGNGGAPGTPPVAIGAGEGKPETGATPAIAAKAAAVQPASGAASAISESKPKPAPSAKSASSAEPKAGAPSKSPSKKVKKKVTISKATTCDLCTQLSVPSCVYACPHEAAMRVDPTAFFARQIGARGAQRVRFRWLSGADENRTTH